MAKRKVESGFDFEKFMAENNLPTLERLEKQQQTYKTYSTGSFMLDIAIGEKDCDTGLPGIPERAIVEMFGINQSCKCFGKNTELRMFDGSVKPVQDIVVGDKLMGPDSSPRTVVSLARGTDDLFRVVPSRGKPWICNSEHVLSLKTSGLVYESHRIRGTERRTTKRSVGEVVNVSVKDFLRWSKGRQRVHSLYKASSPVTFDRDCSGADLDPYFFGIWLGDGDSDGPDITTADPEVEAFVHAFAEKNGAKVRIETSSCSDNKAKHYCVSMGNTGGRAINVARQSLKTLNVLGNKHIPDCYLFASPSTRLELLAGLIDSDGTLCARKGAAFVISTKHAHLAEQIVFIARSLGFDSDTGAYKSTCSYKGRKIEGLYYSVRISGDTERIPTKIPRKKAPAKGQRRADPLTRSFTIKPIGRGEFFGFEVSGPDRLFLMEDFTVAHNSATAEALMKNILDADPKNRALCLFAEEPDVDRMLRLGIDKNRVISLLSSDDREGGIKEETAEYALEIAKTAVQDPCIKLVLIDSIKALCSVHQAFKEGKPTDIAQMREAVAARAVMLNRFLLNFKLYNKRAILFMTNQISDRIQSNPFDFVQNPKFNIRTPGGNGKDFECTIRIQNETRPIWTEGLHPLTKEKLLVGWEVVYNVIKNKYSKRTGYRHAFSEFRFDPAGFRRAKEVLFCAEYLGLVKKTGSIYTIGSKKAVGQEAAIQYLEDHEDARKELERVICERSEDVYSIQDGPTQDLLE